MKFSRKIILSTAKNFAHLSLIIPSLKKLRIFQLHNEKNNSLFVVFFVMLRSCIGYANFAPLFGYRIIFSKVKRTMSAKRITSFKLP